MHSRQDAIDRAAILVAQGSGRPIFFWIAGKVEPRDFQRRVSLGDRKRLARVLTDGRVIASYRGCARCRICRATLGSRTLGERGFVWPEGAEHYVLEHSVWPPGASALLRADAFEGHFAEVGAALPADVERMMVAADAAGIASAPDAARAPGAAFSILFTPLSDGDSIGALPRLVARVTSHSTELARMSPAEQRTALRLQAVTLNFFPVPR